MDYYGVPGWRLSPRLDEGWKIRRKSYSNHTEGSAQRLGLFAFRNETTQRYQRYVILNGFFVHLSLKKSA